MMESKFKLFSICLVATDLIEDEKTIECYPLEHTTYADYDKDHNPLSGTKADINHKETINLTNIKDINDDTHSVILNRKKTVKATWLPFGDSNRVTAPMIKRGETVRVYRYADTDEFYWQTLYNEFDLRRLEKVKHYYSNTQVLDEDLNDNNTYWSLIDTINKNLHLHTSDNDGELTTYDVDINTKAGILKIKDGKGNYIELNSDMDRLHIFINKDITIKSGKSIEITTKKLTTNTKHTIHNIQKVDYVGGMIKHDGISIDEFHVHTGNLGYSTTIPTN